MEKQQRIEIIPWRVYERPLPSGFRVLAERLWPRGVRKEDLPLDAWPKALTPSTELREWFHHDVTLWEEFRQRYLQELALQTTEAGHLLDSAAGRPLILLYASQDKLHNGALVLQTFLDACQRQKES